MTLSQLAGKEFAASAPSFPAETMTAVPAVTASLIAAWVDGDAAQAPDAPVLHEDLFTKGVDPKPDKPSNIAAHVEVGHGDPEAGLAKADIVVEREQALVGQHRDGEGGELLRHRGDVKDRRRCDRDLVLELIALRIQDQEGRAQFGLQVFGQARDGCAADEAREIDTTPSRRTRLERRRALRRRRETARSMPPVTPNTDTRSNPSPSPSRRPW